MSTDTESSTSADVLKDWTSEEKQKYRELYRYHRNQFSKISAELGTKTTKECVFFFYHRHISKIELPRAVQNARQPVKALAVAPKEKKCQVLEVQNKFFLCFDAKRGIDYDALS